MGFEIHISIIWYLMMSLSHSVFLQFEDRAGANKSWEGTGTSYIVYVTNEPKDYDHSQKCMLFCNICVSVGYIREWVYL